MMDLLARAPPSIPQIEAPEAKALLDEGKAVLVDVREEHEWHQARIPGAIHIPMMQVPARAEELPKDATLIIQCHSGQRSFHAGRALAALGFQDVLNLKDGIVAWHSAGYPLEQG